MRWFFLVLCSYLLAACTPMEWRRGDEVATIESDVFQVCRAQATLAGMRYAPFSSPFYYPIVGRNRNGRSIGMSSTWYRSDQMMIEHDYLMQCLVDQGFDLVPIPQPPKPLPQVPQPVTQEPIKAP